MHKKCAGYECGSLFLPSQRAFLTYFLCELHAVICKKFHYFLFLLFKFFCFSSWLFFVSYNPKSTKSEKKFCDMQAAKNMQAWIYIIMAHLWIKWLQNAISMKFTLNCMFIVVWFFIAEKWIFPLKEVLIKFNHV